MGRLNLRPPLPTPLKYLRHKTQGFDEKKSLHLTFMQSHSFAGKRLPLQAQFTKISFQKNVAVHKWTCFQLKLLF